MAKLSSAPLRPSGRRYHDADGLSISLPARLEGDAEISKVISSQQDQLPVPQALARQAFTAICSQLCWPIASPRTWAANSPLTAEESIADAR